MREVSCGRGLSSLRRLAWSAAGAGWRAGL